MSGRNVSNDGSQGSPVLTIGRLGASGYGWSWAGAPVGNLVIPREALGDSPVSARGRGIGHPVPLIERSAVLDHDCGAVTRNRRAAHVPRFLVEPDRPGDVVHISPENDIGVICTGWQVLERDLQPWVDGDRVAAGDAIHRAGTGHQRIA